MDIRFTRMFLRETETGGWKLLWKTVRHNGHLLLNKVACEMQCLQKVWPQGRVAGSKKSFKQRTHSNSLATSESPKDLAALRIKEEQTIPRWSWFKSPGSCFCWAERRYLPSSKQAEAISKSSKRSSAFPFIKHAYSKRVKQAERLERKGETLDVRLLNALVGKLVGRRLGRFVLVLF